MKIVKQIKAGANLAPAYLVILYFFFFILDIVTTYLATPDLKYEGNWLVRYLSFNWIQFILFYFSMILLVIIALFMALNYVHRFYNTSFVVKDSLPRELVGNWKLLLSYIVLGCFYSHVINLGHIVLNNIFSFIFLYQKSSCIYKFTTWYIVNQKFFLLYIQTIPIVIGYILAYLKVRKIRYFLFNILCERPNFRL